MASGEVVVAWGWTSTAKRLRDNFDSVLRHCKHPDIVLGALGELRAALDVVWAQRMTEQASGEPAGASR